MEDTLLIAQSPPPPLLRIEEGQQGAPATTGAALPSWALPTGAAFLVFAGICIAAWGVVWLRRKPAHNASPDELFVRVARALGATVQEQAAAKAGASAAGVPSATGLLVWPARP